jgi:hypothetical protein
LLAGVLRVGADRHFCRYGQPPVILLPLLLLPFVIAANSAHLWVMYGFAYLWWVRGGMRWVRRP